LVGEGGAPVLVSALAKHGLDISPVSVNFAGLTSDQIEMVGNGSYIVNAVGDCAGCHGAAGAMPGFLGGGTQFGGAGAPFTVVSRNLTPDPATGLKLTASQFVTALRTGADFHGVADGGTPTQALVVMPWLYFRWMSTYDLQSIWWYLRSIPPVTNQVAADTKPPIPPAAPPSVYTDGDTPRPLPPETAPDPGNVLRGLAINPLGGVAPLPDPSSQSLFGRGSYLVNAIALCSGCHTNADSVQTGAIKTAVFLTGGKVFATPPPLQKLLGTVRAASANLEGKTLGFFNNPTVVNGGFSVFLALITQGVHAEDVLPDAGPPNRLAPPMPWQVLRNMSLGDLESIDAYLTRVAQTTALVGAADKVIPSPALYCDATAMCPPGMVCSSTTTTPGECLSTTCAVNTDCAACQTCATAGDGGGGTCQAMTGAALAGCLANGYGP
jgi:mono/diheme cytochrome c family protein